MEIRINEETVDITLEDEQVLGDVVDGIQDWLALNGYTVTAVRKDAEEIRLGARLEWQDDPVDEISKLEITALHPADLIVEKLTAAIQYLDLIREEGDPSSPVIADLLKGADDVSEMIDDALLSRTSASVSFGSRFKTLVHATGIPVGEVSVEGFSEFLNYIGELMAVLHSRLRELTDPVNELTASAPLLRDVLEKTGDIAVLLQTGEDSKALGYLIRFLEVSQKMLRLVHNLGQHAVIDLSTLTVDGTPIEEFTAELNVHLLELSQAMEAGDTVLIGDLLEYEIAPRLSALLSTLETGGVL